MSADWVQTLVLALGLGATAIGLWFERRSLHSQDRLRVYQDFFSEQSRWRDAQLRAEEMLAHGEEEHAYELLNARRDATWSALAGIRLVAPKAVVVAADALNRAVAESSPTKGARRQPLDHAKHKALLDTLTVACRQDLLSRGRARR